MHKCHRSLMVGAMLFASIGCEGEIGQEGHGQTLLDTREAAAQAIAEGDVERLFSFWADDTVIYPVSEPAVRGIEAVREYVRRNRQELGLAPRTTPIEIVESESGDLGYIVGTHDWIDREGRASMPGRYVTLWRKNEEGQWKAFLEIHSPRPAEAADMAGLVQSLDLDRPVDLDVDCPLSPPGAREVRFAGVFDNQPPIRPDSPEFPSDFCPPNTLFYARAEGRGNSSVLGEFQWSERYCALPMAEIVAEGHFEDANGDRLNWDARILADSVPPPIPFATFSGEFTFTGGTGPFTDVSGEAVVAAKQLGDAGPGRPAGSTAAAVCGWVADSRQ